MSAESQTASLTIGQVASAAGVATSTIRYYERRGVLPASERISGQRRYEEETVSYLAAIQIAKSAGFSLEEIRTMVGPLEERTLPSELWAEAAEQKMAQIDELIARAEKMRITLKEGLGCGCASFEDCELVQRELLQIASRPE